MPADHHVRYFMTMVNNDQARLFTTALVAGRLIAAWRFRISVSGILCGVSDNIQIRGFRLPVASLNVAPIAVIAAEANPVMDICGLQAATLITTGDSVRTDGADKAIMEAFDIADDILRRFGIGDPLKLLVRALLTAPYDEAGLQKVPRMSDIIARDSATGPWPRAVMASALPATDLPISRPNSGRNSTGEPQ